MWVEPEIRDEVVAYIQDKARRTDYRISDMIRYVGIGRSRYYDWVQRSGQVNRHNGSLPKSHWITPEEKDHIVDYCRGKVYQEGYRRLCYMMIDDDIAYVSPSSVYRILRDTGWLNRWNHSKTASRKGFEQPLAPHEHWHMDISYIKIMGEKFFLICVLDGASRYIVHHELRKQMTEYDVELTLQKAREKFPRAHPRIISDNGSQFISKEFKNFIQMCNYTHVRTSVNHPQSNGKLERFHGTIKSECVRSQSLLSLQDARTKIAAYVNHYNHKRLHSAIYYLTPADILHNRTQKRLHERKSKLRQAQENRKSYYKKG